MSLSLQISIMRARGANGRARAKTSRDLSGRENENISKAQKAMPSQNEGTSKTFVLIKIYNFYPPGVVFYWKAPIYLQFPVFAKLKTTFALSETSRKYAKNSSKYLCVDAFAVSALFTL